MTGIDDSILVWPHPNQYAGQMELLTRFFRKKPHTTQISLEDGAICWEGKPLQLSIQEHLFVRELLHKKVCSAKEFGPVLGSASWKHRLRMLNYNLFYQTKGQCEILVRPNSSDKRGICFELYVSKNQSVRSLFQLFSF